MNKRGRPRKYKSQQEANQAKLQKQRLRRQKQKQINKENLEAIIKYLAQTQ